MTDIRLNASARARLRRRRQTDTQMDTYLRILRKDGGVLRGDSLSQCPERTEQELVRVPLLAINRFQHRSPWRTRKLVRDRLQLRREIHGRLKHHLVVHLQQSMESTRRKGGDTPEGTMRQLFTRNVPTPEAPAQECFLGC